MEYKMSKSGQPAAKADTGGQRVPKSSKKDSGSDKKPAKEASPPKSASGKPPASS